MSHKDMAEVGWIDVTKEHNAISVIEHSFHHLFECFL